MYTSCTVTSDTYHGVPVLILDGDLTSEAEQAVLLEFRALNEKSRAAMFIMNLEKVPHTNSAGLSILITIMQELNALDRKLLFVGMSSLLHKMITVVGLTEFVEIYRSLDEIPLP